MNMHQNGISSAATEVPSIRIRIDKCLLSFLLVISSIVTANYERLSGTSLDETDFLNAEKLTKEELFREMSQAEKMWIFRSDIRSAHNHRNKRNGVSRSAKMWPNARIPYVISTHYSPHERALLAKAVKQHTKKFILNSDYLFIGKVDGCFSEVGRTSGVQVLSLDNGCMDYSTIIHEIMHVVGFYHEHERWDRDYYIDIIWQNIDKTALDQFGKVDLSKTSYYGQPYDYKSILHYDSLAFSKNGFPTMLPKKTGKPLYAQAHSYIPLPQCFAATIGNAKDFSEIDLAKINRMYQCDMARALLGPPGSVDPPPPVQFPSAKAQIAPIYTAANKDGRLPWPPRGHTFYEIEKASFDNKEHPKGQQVCEDRITVCWWTQDRCNASNINHIMRSLCAKTCKFC